MKYSLLAILFTMSAALNSASSGEKRYGQVTGHNTIENNNNENTMSNKIIIKVNSETFTATLLDNNSVKAFKAMLPVTFDMAELNGNEKYFDLPKNLPTTSSNPGTIQNGDLMLYGSNTLVLFYKTFSTSYSYTKIGKIDNVAGLAVAVGSGSVAISFELSK